MSDVRQVTSPSPGVVWATVDDGFHVASDGGNFIGYVDRADGWFVAFDPASRRLGRYADLRDAMAAVDGQAQ